MATIPNKYVQCVVTSAPWYGENIGSEEKEVTEYRTKVFEQFARILKDDGVVFWETFKPEWDVNILGKFGVYKIIKWGDSRIWVAAKQPIQFDCESEWDIPKDEYGTICCLRCGKIVDAVITMNDKGLFFPTTKCECGSDKFSQHGATFPVGLPMKCIPLCTEGGDWVLDPFCGFGATGEAAYFLKRNAILIDINLTACMASRRRLN